MFIFSFTIKFPLYKKEINSCSVSITFTDNALQKKKSTPLIFSAESLFSQFKHKCSHKYGNSFRKMRRVSELKDNT